VSGGGGAVGGDRSTAWLERVASARVARLATTRPDGPVDLVAFTFAWVPTPAPYGRLVSAVDHKPKRHGRLQRLANIAAHPDVTVLVDHYDDDWSRLWWVRLRGRAVEQGDDEGLRALVEKYEPYRGRPPAGAVLRIELTELRGWSASGS
jgi:PPOX class probable F420-dependent enzyme